MKVLGLIPARGGSKGVPRKNIKLLCGKPLLQYTAEAALSARLLTRVILTTEDEEIAAVGRSCGLEVPFLRPAELARDDTPTLPVVQHAIKWLEDHGETYDAVCLLQPSSPLRRAEEIDGCIQLLEASGADAVVTVLPVPAEYNPHWVYLRDETGLLHLSSGQAEPPPQRQSLPAAFHREGSVYVTRRDVLMIGNSLYGQRLEGYLIASDQRVNIDSRADWNHAEEILDRAITLELPFAPETSKRTLSPDRDA
jgi:CMP-N-acetylneuraminic acid synthetase